MIRRMMLLMAALLVMNGVLTAKTKVSSAVPARVGGVVAFRDGNDVVAYFSLYDKNDREIGANGAVNITLRLIFDNAPEMYVDCAQLCRDRIVKAKEFQQKMVGSGIFRSSRKILIERRKWDEVKQSGDYEVELGMEDMYIKNRLKNGWSMRVIIEFVSNGQILTNFSNVDW